MQAPDFAKPIVNAPATQSPAPQAASPAKKVYFLGDKRFDSEEALIEYTRALQEQANQLQAIRQQVAPEPAVNKKKLSDLIFEDTDKAIEILRNEIKTEIKQEDATIQERHAVVNRFFQQNPDLKNHEDLCDLYATRMQKEIANMSEAERFSKVAQEVRSRIATIKGTQGSTEELSNRPAVTLGASGGQPTAQSGVKIPQSFTDQIRKLQRKGK